MRRAICFCGKFLFWGVVVVGLAAAGALLMITSHVDEAVRAEVQRVFTKHYAGLHVSVRSAQRVEGQGLFVRGLSIKSPDLEGPRSELLYVDEILLATRNTLDDLMLGQLRVDHISLRRMALRAVRRPDGTWSTTRLLPLPDFGGPMPTATIEDGSVEIFDPQRSPPSTLTLRRINLQITPGRKEAVHRQVETQAVLNVEGKLAGDVFEEVTVAGWLDPAAGNWAVAGSVEQLLIAPETWQALPGSLTPHAAAMDNFHGKADATFDVAFQPGWQKAVSASAPYQFDIRGKLYDGRYEDGRLPFPLHDIAAQVRLSNSGWRIDGLTAEGSGSTFQLDLRRDGWSETSPLSLQASAQRFHVDDSMAELLPAPLADLWRQYRPRGLLNADVAIAYDGRSWTPELTVHCLDTSFVYENFPYPITGAQGEITLEGDLLNFAVQARAAGEPLTIQGSFENATKAPAGWVEYICEGPVPIDSRLLAALDTDALRGSRDVLVMMDAGGNLASSGRFDVVRLPSGEAQVNEHVHLRWEDGSVEYEKFPYPLHDITGEIELWNGQYTFRNLQGQNDSGRVACHGSYRDDGEGPRLTLNVVCRDLPLEEELRRAFAPNVQQVWASLRPQGTLDRVNMQLRYSPHNEQLDISLAAVKWPENQGATGQPVSIYPQAFPYRLNQLEGELRYRNGYIELNNLSARHGTNQVAVSGFCEMGDDGSWRLQFSRLNTENLSFDRDLISALPEDLAAGIAPLNVRGPVTLSGAIEFRRGGRPQDQIITDWDINVDLENGRIQCGVALNNIHGAIRLTGTNSEHGFHSRGELNVDSLMYQGFQFTHVQGPIWIDRDRVAFGAWAETPQQGQSPRRLQARLLGGTVAADAHVALDGDKYFTLQAQLDQADLAQFAREFLPRQRKISGRASGTLRLSGTSSGTDTLRGDGHLWLRNADIYELPLMVALLKILKIKPLDKTAFTSSDVDFHINGEDIYLDRIVFNGDAISLKGAGEVNLQRRVNLKFYTLVGNESRRIPLIWPLLADASRRILMIEVTGSLENPVTTRNVLPGLNSTIERLFSEELGAPGGQNRPARTGSDRPQYQR